MGTGSTASGSNASALLPPGKLPCAISKQLMSCIAGQG